MQPEPPVDVDLAVIGLGPIGAGALRRAAASGVGCIGIGQPEPAELTGHAGLFASHYDSGRITRHIDETFEWAELARRAIADYASIEAASGIRFHHPSGVVYAAADQDADDRLAAVAGRLAATGVTVTRHTASPDPRVRLAPPIAWHEGPPAGHVDPRQMIAAQLAAARADAARTVAGVVTRLQPTAHGWALDLSDASSIVAARVVLAGGPHTAELGGLPVVPDLRVRGETVVMATLDAGEQERLAGLPAVIAPVEHEAFADVYLVPPTTYPDGSVRLKLGATRHSPIALDTAVERRAWMSGDAHCADLDSLRSFVLDLLPGLRVGAWETKPCLLTDTPTGLPYVDHLADGLVIAAGCNGYAAKSGDAIGALAADLAIQGSWTDPVLGAADFAVVTA